MAGARPRNLGGAWQAQHFTVSKVLCWVALDRGAGLAEARGDAERAQRWRELADEIHAEVCERGVDERGVFVQHYETSALDASALLIPLMGFLLPQDERVRATVLAIADELTEDRLVLRYRVEHTDDGLEGEEGTFTICSFWLVTALCQIGETERARSLCRLQSRQPARAVRRGDRRRERPSPGELPPGVHPPLADRGGDGVDRGRRKRLAQALITGSGSGAAGRGAGLSSKYPEPSMLMWGRIRSSQRGSQSVFLPAIVIRAGTKRHTTIASIATAVARPRPNCLIVGSPFRTKLANTRT